jgi:hypothetical protein
MQQQQSPMLSQSSSPNDESVENMNREYGLGRRGTGGGGTTGNNNRSSLSSVDDGTATSTSYQMSSTVMTESGTDGGTSRSSDESSTSISLDKTSTVPLHAPRRQQQQQQSIYARNSAAMSVGGVTAPISNTTTQARMSPLNPSPLPSTSTSTSSSLTPTTRVGTPQLVSSTSTTMNTPDISSSSTSSRRDHHADSTTGLSAGMGGIGTTTTPTPPVFTTSVMMQECDYDFNPTVLYQAIEAKQWEYAISIFTKNKQDNQSSTWVIRKESNGKLRWRLLPLHAAVIFGAPFKLVELLVADYPYAAQSKDDQGMLPLHLAFRNEAQFDVIDELLTAYPMAVFVSDRKGRTPLLCGTSRSMKEGHQNNSNNNNSNTGNIASLTASAGSAIIALPSLVTGATNTLGGVGGGNSNGDSTNRGAAAATTTASFRSVVSVLKLYSQIAVSGERKRAELEARTLASTGVTQLQDAHYKTLTALKKEWESQRLESKKQMDVVENDRTALRVRVQELEQELATRAKAQQEAESKVRKMTIALNQANDRVKAKNPAIHNMQRTNQMLRMVTEGLVEQQRSYHRQVEEVLQRMQQLVQERETIRSVFVQETTNHQSKEQAMLESFQTWFQEQGRKISVAERSLEEEKKVEDDVLDFVAPSPAILLLPTPTQPTPNLFLSNAGGAPPFMPSSTNRPPVPPLGSTTPSMSSGGGGSRSYPPHKRGSSSSASSSPSPPVLVPFAPSPSPTHRHLMSSISLPELETGHIHHDHQPPSPPPQQQHRARSLGSWHGSSSQQDIIDLSLIDLSDVKSDD